MQRAVAVSSNLLSLQVDISECRPIRDHYLRPILLQEKQIASVQSEKNSAAEGKIKISRGKQNHFHGREKTMQLEPDIEE